MLQPEVTFVIPYREFLRLLRSLLAQPYHVALGPMGVKATNGQLELLLRHFQLVPEAEVAARGRELASRFEMAFSPHPLLRPRC
ncbi:MAG TPA: hypothetical protein EYP85_11140, partial [Armatimonadetes bacterium]|nr:hypothetical protein [Armatimonadota bacterium]